MTGFPSWALAWLRCPHCGGVLGGDDDPETGSDPDGEAGRARQEDLSIVGCGAGHRFDVARQGYLPLLGPRARTDTGDDARMVAARSAFLTAGWYRPIADAVAGAVRGGPPGAARGAADGRDGAPTDREEPAGDSPVGTVDADAGPVVEVGAGTGYYLAAACGADAVARASDPRGGASQELSNQSRGPANGSHGSSGGSRGLAIDASRYALRRAARLPGIAAVLADAWSPLPVRDGVAAAVLSVFAPRDPAELVRIVAPGGRIVVVTPEPDHLAELRGPLPLLAVDAGKAERVVQAFGALPVTAVDSRAVRYPVELPRSAVTDLVAMGPTARHLDPEALAGAVAGLPEPVSVTVSVTVTTLMR